MVRINTIEILLEICHQKYLFSKKKPKFGGVFQNNPAKCWLYEKYSPTLHPRYFEKIRASYIRPKISTDVDGTDCRKQPRQTSHEGQVQRPDRTDVRFPSGRVLGRGQRAESPRHSAHGDHQAVRHAVEGHLPAEDLARRSHRAKRMFNVAMAKVDYKGSYNYCYCTKSSHFSFVLEEAMKNDIHLETSSAYDIHIINALYDSGIIDKDRYIICNGFKRPQYVENIAQLVDDGFENTIPVLDNKEEAGAAATPRSTKKVQGRHPHRLRGGAEIRVLHLASGHPLQRHRRLLQAPRLKTNKKFQLKMLHFFINTGIKDTAYYWNELWQVPQRLLRVEGHLPRTGQPEHRRRLPDQELAQLRVRLRVPDRGDRRPDQAHLPDATAPRSPTSSPSSDRSPWAKAARRSIRSSTRSSRTTARTGT